jgi:hypothetical protein
MGWEAKSPSFPFFNLIARVTTSRPTSIQGTRFVVWAVFGVTVIIYHHTRALPAVGVRYYLLYYNPFRSAASVTFGAPDESTVSHALIAAAQIHRVVSKP